jgi:nucleotide-binding universal stress UspA family protein
MVQHMIANTVASPVVRRVMVATDRSATANNAVGWAATLAAAHQADLMLLQVLPETSENGVTRESAEADLKQYATAIAGSRGQARVVVASDLAQAIIDAAEAEKADVLVVGNVGMSGRKQFLLSNIPNRISHHARCSVVISARSSRLGRTCYLPCSSTSWQRSKNA